MISGEECNLFLITSSRACFKCGRVRKTKAKRQLYRVRGPAETDKDSAQYVGAVAGYSHVGQEGSVKLSLRPPKPVPGDNGHKALCPLFPFQSPSNFKIEPLYQHQEGRSHTSEWAR